MSVRATGTQKLTRTASVASVGTLCGWIRYRSALNNYEGYIALGNSGATDGVYLGNDQSSWGITSYDGAVRAHGALTAPGVDTWLFAALTYTAGAGGAIGYQRLASANALSSASVTGPTMTNAGVAVLSTVYDGTDYADGCAYNVKCWDRVLTAAELLIESYYLRVMFPASINFHWPLFNHSDVNDYSGNARNPTVTGTLSTEDDANGIWVPSRKIFIPTAASGNRDVSASQATLTLTGQASTVNKARGVAATQATLTLTAQASTVNRTRSVAASQATLTLTGQAAGVNRARSVQATTQALTITGQTATVGRGSAREVLATQATLTVTGQTATVTRSRGVNATTATLTLSSQNASIQRGEAARPRFGGRLYLEPNKPLTRVIEVEEPVEPPQVIEPENPYKARMAALAKADSSIPRTLKKRARARARAQAVAEARALVPQVRKEAIAALRGVLKGLR